MSGDIHKFIWQHEYNKKWKNYTYGEMGILNKAVMKMQKTVTLPTTDPKKKVTCNLEKMFQKNAVSGYEQRMRCIVPNGGFVTWSWKDDYDSWICYTPRISFFLEFAFIKRLEKIDVFLKTDYEINFVKMVQINKETEHTRSISRVAVDPYDHKDASSYIKLIDLKDELTELMERMCEKSESSVHALVFDLPMSNSSKSSNSPVHISHHVNIVKALNAEVQASSMGESSRPDPNTFIPVDPACPDAKMFHIYCDDNGVYNATLNFTSLQANNNKFFIIQLLKRYNKNLYAVWFHWGRLGYKGQHKLMKFSGNLDEAISTFEKKFYDKTHNSWGNRKEFERNPSKYDLVHTDLNCEESIEMTTIVEETKLDPRVQILLNIICDKKSLEDAAKEMLYDSSITPLGKITPKQILEGYVALDKITKIIRDKGKGKDLIEACNNFYTKIPHDFKRKTPTVLLTIEDVKEKLKMLEALSNIGLAMDVLNTTTITNENPVDKYYRSLECNLIPLAHNSDKFRDLNKCLYETHGPTHGLFTMEIIDAFECVKDEQESSFLDYDNKKLLWHGSRISNWLGILKKGLQIAPPEAPSTGYMFGKGIYFADVSSKSANYCFATKKKDEGILLLCEVSLGNPMNVHHAEDLSCLEGKSFPVGLHSVKGVGRYHPVTFDKTVLSNEALIPRGPLKENASKESLSLFYNEYVVYNVHQVKMKYLLRIKFYF